MLKIVLLSLLSILAAGTCEECGRQIDQAVSDFKTAIATYVPTPAPARQTTLLAVGDSVAAGDDIALFCSDATCGDKSQSYPGILAAFVRATYDSSLYSVNVSCSGATPRQVWENSDSCSDNQRAQVSTHFNWVTITVGADNLLHIAEQQENWHCLAKEEKELKGDEKRQCEQIVTDALSEASTYLGYLIQEAAAQSDLVVVTGYYHMYSKVEDGKISDRLNDYIDRLNKVIKGNAECCGLKNVHYVDLSKPFKGHEWGSDDSWLQRRPACEGIPDWSHEQSNLRRTVDTAWEYLLEQLGIHDESQIVCLMLPAVHPSARGQQEIAKAVWEAIYKQTG